MTTVTQAIRSRHVSVASVVPLVVFALGIAALIVPSFFGDPVAVGNWYNVGQRMAMLALPAVGLALTMIVGEFDMSVPGAFLLGSVIAVRYGTDTPYLWMVVSVVVVTLLGMAAGALIAYFEVNSICVTLGSYLAMSGAVYVISDDKSLSFANYEIGIAMTKPIGGVLALNIIIVIAVVAAIGLVLSRTRWGPQLRAVGSDRRSAVTVGVKPARTLIAVFGISAGVSALAGVLQGYSLAFAQPSTSTLLLSLAATCALVGGVSISGGIGSITGVAFGVIAYACMEEALTRARVEETMASVVTGALLLIVAVVAAPELRDRLRLIMARLRIGSPPSRAD